MLDKGKISNTQIIFLIIGFILGSQLIISVFENILKRDTWLAVILGTLEGIILGLLFSSIGKKFKDNNLFDINKIVYGKYIGKTISVLYVFLFIFVATMNLRYFSDFFVNLVMPETPILAIMILISFVTGSAVRNGIEVISRLCAVFVFITGFEVLLSIPLLIKDMDFTNFLPLLDISAKDFFLGTQLIASVFFGKIVFFLMIFPHVTHKKNLVRNTLIAILIGGAFLFLITVRNTAVLGQTVGLFTYPTFQTMKTLDVGDIITRLDVLLISSLLFTMFIKMSVTCYVTVIGITNLFNLRVYKPFVSPIIIIILCLSLTLFESYGDQIIFGINNYTYISLPFELLFPVFILLMAKTRLKQ